MRPRGCLRVSGILCGGSVCSLTAFVTMREIQTGALSHFDGGIVARVGERWDRREERFLHCVARRASYLGNGRTQENAGVLRSE
jgi:hypothetical protein